MLSCLAGSCPPSPSGPPASGYSHSTAGPQAWGFSEPFRSLGAALSVLSTSQALLGSVELGFPVEI